MGKIKQLAMDLEDAENALNYPKPAHKHHRFDFEQAVAQEAEIRLMERNYESSKNTKNLNTWWRLWAKSLGQKTGLNDKEADQIAWIRTVVVVINFVTCLFIIAGIIRHW